MKRLCKMCAGTGRLTSLDQLSRSTAPSSVPCGMCGGLGFVDDFGCRTQDANLAAENERLKAKLEKIRVECKIRQYGVMDSDFDFGLAQMADVIMAIIDKDGDEA